MKADGIYFLLGGIFCAAILAGSIHSNDIMIIIGALSVAVVVMIAGIKSPYRGFYTLCFGEAPVLAVIPSYFAAGLAAQLVLIVLFLYSTGIFAEQREFFVFVAYALLMIGASLVLVSFKNPGLLFIASIIISGAGVLGLIFNEYRIRLRVGGVDDEETPV